MLRSLKQHPFGVRAFFDNSLVLTYAFPKESLANYIPECLELDLFQDKWAFVAVAMVQTKNLRPSGFPGFLGNDFFLIGYRIFVRYRNREGKNLRGLYIIKSETDQKRMQIFGNLFTNYRYTTTDISDITSDNIRTVKSENSKFEVVIDQSSTLPELPDKSPFSDWKEARRFAGPLPFTFTFDEIRREVLIIEGVRQNWTPTPVKVLHQDFSFFEDRNLADAQLANAFEITNVPYYWRKGKLEKLI